jgi:hypothetical protein
MRKRVKDYYEFHNQSHVYCSGQLCTYCRWLYPLAGPAHANVYVIWPEPHGRPRGSRRSPNPPHMYCISSPWIWEICHTAFGQSVYLTFYHYFQHTAPEGKYSTMKKLFHDGYFIHSFVNFHIAISITTSSKDSFLIYISFNMTAQI